MYSRSKRKKEDKPAEDIPTQDAQKLKDEIASLKREIANKEEEIKEKDAQIAEKVVDISTLQLHVTDLGNLQETCATNDESLTKAREKLSEAESSLQKALDELAKERENSSTSEGLVKKLKKDLGLEKAKGKKQEKDLNKATTDLEGALDQIKQITIQKEKLDALFKGEESKTLALSKELHDLKEKSTNLEGSVTDLTKQIKGLQSQLKVTKDELEARQVTIDGLSDELSEAQQDAQNKENSIIRLTSEIGTLKVDHDMNKQIETVVYKLNDVNEEIKSTTPPNDEFQKNFNDMLDEIGKLIEFRKTLTADLERRKHVTDSLEAQITKLQEENNKLKEKQRPSE